MIERKVRVYIVKGMYVEKVKGANQEDFLKNVAKLKNRETPDIVEADRTRLATWNVEDPNCKCVEVDVEGIDKIRHMEDKNNEPP